jgi:hypothetical protein
MKGHPLGSHVKCRSRVQLGQLLAALLLLPVFALHGADGKVLAAEQINLETGD